MEQNYHLFTKADFLEDAFFLEWVKHGTPEAIAFWEAYRDSAPPNAAALEEARETLTAILCLKRIKPADTAKAQVWSQIQAHLAAETPVVPITRFRRKRWLAAAVLLPLMLLTAWYFMRPSGMHRVESGYGQQVRVKLPDASVVILNSHSALTYHNWKDGKREVWLEGEALFEVKHTEMPAAQHFTVHAGKVDVEVLGTVFNVKQRREITEVYLRQGKVKVSSPDNGQILLLQPNEKATYHRREQLLAKNTADAKTALAWREYKMLLKQTTVRDIIHTLQDTYGFTIILQDTSIANRTLEGTLSLNNVNNVLFELSAILNVKIEKNNDTLYLKDNGQRGY
ncbi:FecR family protein [Chitinophaga varians]|uniref:FecR family protein n=1 Tax=Chitinophaga varians TaxID=2202339 RepID=UPI00165EE13D|nr:FecR domain-containing protein [Chitinophaga varians]MBC9910417.1 FecR domain-containing protein [Chitinophaga varians]